MLLLVESQRLIILGMKNYLKDWSPFNICSFIHINLNIEIQIKYLKNMIIYQLYHIVLVKYKVFDDLLMN